MHSEIRSDNNLSDSYMCTTDDNDRAGLEHYKMINRTIKEHDVHCRVFNEYV